MFLFLGSSLTASGGGIELHDRQLCEALARSYPDRLSAVLYQEPHLTRPQLLSSRLRSVLEVVGPNRTGWPARAEVVARSLLSTHRARVLFCGHVHYAGLAAALALSHRIPWVAMAHGVELREPSRLQRAGFCRASSVWAVSSHTAARARELGVPAPRVRVIHNAVDTERFCPGPVRSEILQRLASLPRPRALTVGRLDAREGYKGVDRVLAALATLPTAVSYVVVGDGSDRGALEERARRYPQLRVLFWGQASDDDLVDLYRSADVFVMPSRGEGFGYVFIEALACGVPVVAGDRDGSRDALANGALGLLVDPDDNHAIAKAISDQLFGVSPAPLRDAARLRREVTERFSEGKLAGNIRAALDPLLS